MQRRSNAARAAVAQNLLALLLAASGGCALDPYCIDHCADADLDAEASVREAGPDVPRDRQVDARGLDGCVPNGTEVCNGRDDDCNGQTDEGVLPQVGGTCSRNVGECRAGTLACVAGTIVCGGGGVLPAPESCNNRDDDCDGATDNGDPGGGVAFGSDVGDCERGSTVCQGGQIRCSGGTGPSPEVCDGRDNNCDGQIDEGNPGGGAACGATTGGCAQGVMTCLGGALMCQGAGLPSPERCDHVDNDCDGATDEDFDLQTDVRNCGACGAACAPDHAVGQCTGGACALAACQSGYFDVDGVATNGCEYRCDLRGAEVCNGADDDCDGQTDEGLTPPAICAAVGECAGTVASCSGAAGWMCRYGSSVSTGPGGAIVPETDCDDRDNDCNGRTDDAFATRGTDCTRGLGACVTHGTLVCNATHDGLDCNAGDPPAGTPEVCNGIDDDCNGVLDDNAPDQWVTVTGPFGTKQIYAYEASRPDATGAAQGSLTHRSCSAPGRLPWTSVTHAQAEAACTAAGARLCTEAEWQAACETAATTACRYSYASNCGSYQGSTCNGNDYDSDPIRPGDQDAILPGGTLASCYADWGAAGRVFDLSGNVKEWTAARSAGVNPLRGGAYNTLQLSLSCQYAFVVADDAFLFDDVGFRCCRD